MEGQFDQAGALGVLRQVLDRELLEQRAQVGLDRLDDSPDLSISPDYRAVATTFSKFVIETETGKGARV
jgi:hypothetical protein